MRALGMRPSARTDMPPDREGQSTTATRRMAPLELIRTVKKKILQCQQGTFWELTCAVAWLLPQAFGLGC